MRVPRVFVDAPLSAGQTVRLEIPVHHHLVHVLHLKAGAPLIIFNGRGNEYTATLDHAGRGASTAVIDERVSVDRETALVLELWQGVPKGARMDYVLQKAVELGVARIRPVLTRHTSASRADWRRKLAHWRGVIISACEQSGRTRVPELCDPVPLADCSALDTATTGLALDPNTSEGLGSIAQAPRRATVLIGPEGGLADDELEFAQQLGFRRVHLGPRTLRTETAGVAALVAAQILWGDLR